MLVKKTFGFRLEPNDQQRFLLARFAGCARYVYNWGLAARKAAYEAEGGHWFVYFACEVVVPDPVPLRLDVARVVGIDVGLKDFAVLSDSSDEVVTALIRCQ